MPVSRLIDRLQEESQELTLLTDPDDGDRVVGLVTVSDAFEVIAGDLQDPLDRAVPAEDAG
jgi:CBS domain containing-hemolysin-like protein